MEHMPLIPVDKSQRQAVQGQPGLRSEFQDSQGYVVRPCLQNKTKNKQTNKKQIDKVILQNKKEMDCQEVK